MKTYGKIYMYLLSFCAMLSIVASAPHHSYASQDIPEVPTKGMVTMVDLGAKSCIPCKMMAPIMAELEKEYAGRASIEFIDVWENPEIPDQYGLEAIPTQIFYDADGKERYRHVGFLDKESIVAKLSELGVK